MEVENEEWRDILGYEGLYQVSNIGHVRSFKIGGKWILKKSYKIDYEYVSLNADGRGRSLPVHRLVATAFIPNTEGKPFVNHKDGNRFNNCADNLEWVTIGENSRHAYDTGLNKGRGKSQEYFPCDDFDDEQWCDIDGFNGKYQISNYGRIKSFERGKWILRRITKDGGYLRISLCKNNKVKNYPVHRLVAQAFIPNPEGKSQVDHINGNKTDNRACNLQWVTQRENLKLAYRNGLGRVYRGDSHKNALLSNEDAKFIREHYKSRDAKFGSKALAKRFGVSRATILNIAHGKVYTEVSDDYSPYTLKGKLSVQDVLYIREHYKPYDSEFVRTALAKKFGVCAQTIANIVQGKLYVNIGGKISDKTTPRKLTEDQVRLIRENCIPHDAEFGKSALARQFGVGFSTIQNILIGKTHRDVI